VGNGMEDYVINTYVAEGQEKQEFVLTGASQSL